MKFKTTQCLIGLTFLASLMVPGVVFAGLKPGGAGAQAQRPEIVPGEIVVRFKTAQASGMSAGAAAQSAQTLQSLPVSLRTLHSRYNLKRMRHLMVEDAGLAASPVLQAKLARRQRKAPAGSVQRAEAAKASLQRTYVLTFNSATDVNTVIAAYRKDPNVESVFVNYQAHAFFVPNDPYDSSSNSWGQGYQDLWGLYKIHAQEAWDLSTGTGVIVAVVDTGVDYNHPDLAANVWVNPVDGSHGYNFVSLTNDPMDDNGHGTHVSGTIAAVGNNALGVIGVAFQSQIMAVKILDATGSGTFANGASGILWAVDHGADVINCSWGGVATFQPLQDAMTYAHAHGVVVVTAAGNSSTNVTGFIPASYPEVITVSATDINDQKADFSNFGTKIDVAAPGGNSTTSTGPYEPYYNILSLKSAINAIATADPGIVVGGSYMRLAGTSMASPHVAGLAALIVSQHPEYTNEQVRAVLRSSADDVDVPGFDINTGFGRINAFHALTSPPPPPPAPPTIAILAPSNGASLSGLVTISGTASSNQGIAQVTLLSDSQVLGTATGTNSWTFGLDTELLSNGTHTLTAQVTDLSNLVSSASITVTVSNSPATYNPGLKVPACMTLGSVCSSGGLLNGRDTMSGGPELNQPNTLQNSCADGTAGTYHSDESLDKLRISTLDGGQLAPGKTAKIDATVWAYAGYTGDYLDLYYTANVSTPSWTYLTTLQPTAAGQNTLSATYILPPGGVEAIRGQFRYGGAATPCSAGIFDDHDDLAFALVIDTTPPSAPGLPVFSSATSTSLIVSWPPAVDDVAVAGYRIDVSTTNSFVTYVPGYQDLSLGNVTSTGVYGLSPQTTYYARVRAFDGALNLSSNSAVAQGATLAASPPTISIYLPYVSTATFGIEEVDAYAYGQNLISRVDYFIDGQFQTSASTYPYTDFWDTTASSSAPHTISAIAYDMLGLSSNSNAINVAVSNLTLFQDNFSGTLSSWTVLDEGTISAPSAWAITGGVLTQTSPIYGTDPVAKPGTMLLTGTPAWTDYSFTSQMRAGNGSIGVVFRYKDNNNYYRWSMDPDGFTRMVEKFNGSIYGMTQTLGSYAPGQWYTVTVDVKNYLLRIFVDGKLAAEANNAAMANGGIGFYTWQTTDASFKNVNVLASQIPNSTPPSVSIQAPANGALLLGLTTMSGTASAAAGQGVSQVAILSDGQSLGLATGTTSWVFALDTEQLANGPHTLTAQATGSNNIVGSSSITVTVSNTGIASYNPVYKTPACTTVGSVCTSAGLLTGRDTMALGPEPNQPNTIQNSCADGTAGTFHVDESNDKLRVFALDGVNMAAGKGVKVEATVWAYGGYTADFLDLYYTATVSSPTWTYIATLNPTVPGSQVLSATYTLPTSGLQAVRAQFRYQGSAASPCSTGPYDDHDDLVFAVVVDTTPPTAPSNVVFSSPTASSLQLLWNAATDDVGVAGYRVDVSTDNAFAVFVSSYNNLDVGNTTSLLVVGLASNTTFYARVRAYDAILNTSTNSIPTAGMTLPLAPVITSSPTVYGKAGDPFASQITATNNPTSFSATSLPVGLSLSTGGLISGLPVAGGTTTVNLSATNAGGTGTALLTVVIDSGIPPSLAVSSTSTFAGQDATLSVNFSTGSVLSITGITWDLTLPDSTTLTSVQIGSAAVSAGKTLTLTPLGSNKYHFVIVGQNAFFINPGGALAYVQVHVATGTPIGVLPVALTGVDYTDASGDDVPGVSTGGSITVLQPPDTTPPTVPTNVSFSNPTLTSLLLSWTPSVDNVGVAFYAADLSLTPAFSSFSTWVVSTSSLTFSPLTSGTTYYARVRAFDAAQNSSSYSVTAAGMTLPLAPVITSSSTATGIAGIVFNYQISATNNPISFGATGLPAGLAVNAGTGLISGTPTAVGISSITLSASNAGGTGVQILILSVHPMAVPVITSPKTATGTLDSAFTYMITATNGPTHFNATGLTPGLTINTGTGLISGTPTKAGSYSVGLSATNLGGTGTATLSLTIQRKPRLNSLSLSSSLSPAGSSALTSSDGASPLIVAAGAPAYILQAQGSDFATGDTLQWNNSAVSTTLADPTQLNAVLPGTYLTGGTVTVQVVTQTGDKSDPLTLTISLASGNPASARVHPNPWRVPRDVGAKITFDQMNNNSTVKIFTISAHLVATLSASNGSVQWDLKNQSGDDVASGLYLYLVTDDQGNKTHGKLAIIR